MRREMSGAGYRNTGKKADMGQGKVRDVPWLFASLPEVCNPVWRENQETWTVSPSERIGIKNPPSAAMEKLRQRADFILGKNY